MEIATFAAGCFWGVEFKFSKVPGVIATRVGYCNGHTINPSYEQVCRGDTGHAESIEVQFDPTVISYETLLYIFWEVHNPTTLNRQGLDIGTQYRSAVFYHDATQQQLALSTRAKLESPATKRYPNPIITEISAADIFYPAEEYHQKYLAKNGANHC